MAGRIVLSAGATRRHQIWLDRTWRSILNVRRVAGVDAYRASRSNRLEKNEESSIACLTEDVGSGTERSRSLKRQGLRVARNHGRTRVVNQSGRGADDLLQVNPAQTDRRVNLERPACRRRRRSKGGYFGSSARTGQPEEVRLVKAYRRRPPRSVSSSRRLRRGSSSIAAPVWPHHCCGIESSEAACVWKCDEPTTGVRDEAKTAMSERLRTITEQLHTCLR